MKITSTIFLLFISLTLAAQANDAEAFFNGSYDKDFISKNDIRQVTVETFVNENKTTTALFDFERNGYLTKQTIVDSSGKKLNEYTFTYNEQGHQTERVNISYELNKTYTVSFTKTYNGTQLVKETSTEQPFVTTHVYNKKGNKIQSTTLLNTDSASTAKQVILYTYGANKKIRTTKETYFESGSAAASSTVNTTYHYDAAGNLQSVTRQGKAGYTYSYSKLGLLKSKITSMPGDTGGLTITDKYSYLLWK